jgi:hypothetical protein
MISVPSFAGVGVKFTEHVALAVVPVKVQVLGAKVPVELENQLTVPDGVVAVVKVSVTVMPQDVAVLLTTLEGVQETETVVGCATMIVRVAVRRDPSPLALSVRGKVPMAVVAAAVAVRVTL